MSAPRRSPARIARIENVKVAKFYGTIFGTRILKLYAKMLEPHISLLNYQRNKMLSYRRETALQGTLVLAESGRLELRDNISLIL